MFMFGLFLAGGSMYIEYYMVRNWKWFYKLMHSPRSALISLFFSLFLSAVLGSVFGAEGMTVMFAGIVSTVMMQPVYSMMRKGTWDPSITGTMLMAKIVTWPIRILGRMWMRFTRQVSKFDKVSK
jgi:hypothetical protein